MHVGRLVLLALVGCLPGCVRQGTQVGPETLATAANTPTPEQPAPPGPTPGSPPLATAPTTAAARAVAIVQALHSSKRSDTYAGFGPDLRAAVPEPQFDALLDGLGRELGALGDVRALGELPVNELTSVHLAAFYERGARRYQVALDAAGVVHGLFVQPFVEVPPKTGPADAYVAKRAYQLPLTGAWNVANGGRDAKQNHHAGNPQQWYALDLDRPPQAPPPAGATANEQHGAWDQPVVAPADGTVVTVVQGVPDHGPEHTDRYFVPGNLIVIDHGDSEYSFLAHLKSGSIVVRPGQRVRRGALLGRVGNSGNSSAPHLHWHLANHADVSRGHGLPIRLEPLRVNGTRIETPAPVRGDTVENSSGAR